MEIEALKNRWVELEKKLEQNKSLNERFIKEMIDRRAGKIDTAINRLLFRDIYALVFMLVMFACLLYLYFTRESDLMFWNIVVIMVGVPAIPTLAWYFIKIYRLMKVGMNKSVKSNLFYISKYNIQVKREQIGNVIYMAIAFVLLLFFVFVDATVYSFMWLVIACGIPIVLAKSYWSYKKVYQKNIYSIQNSLEEIRGLEEEEEEEEN